MNLGDNGQTDRRTDGLTDVVGQMRGRTDVQMFFLSILYTRGKFVKIR